MLEPFEINFPNTFEVFDPTITDKTYVGNHNTGGSKIFEYVLIPREKGSFIIPSISFSYFNPNSEKYEEIFTKVIQVNVEQGKKYFDSDTSILSKNKLDLIPNSGYSKISFRNNIFKYYSKLFLVIILSLFSLITIKFILSKRVVNITELRKRKSTKIAIKRLKNAQKCIENNNFSAFFEEIEKSLWGYFADKFNISSAICPKKI